MGGVGLEAEYKLGVFPGLAADENLALVDIHDGAADGKPQAYAVFIQAAAAVGLIEPVEEPWDLLRQDAGAGIAHRYHDILALGIKVEGKGAALIDKFDGVIDEIIHHLLDEVGISQHPVAVGIQPLHLDVLFLQPLLEAKQGIGDKGGDLHLGGLDGALAGLDLAEGEHIAHQAGKALDLTGDNAQIVVLPLRRDGAIQDTIDKAADGGHGGF